MVRDASSEDAEALALIHATSWRETYSGLLPESVIANFAYERTLARWQERLPATPPQAVLVWGDPPAGYVYCGREREGDPRYSGEVYAIYLLAARHRQGGGETLMRAAATASCPRLRPPSLGGTCRLR